MPKYYPLKKTVTVAASGGSSTGQWAEDATVDDNLRSLLVANPEDVGVHDNLAYTLVTNPENANVDDAWSQFILPKYAEDSNVNDLVKLQMIDLQVGRSGTPDSDPSFDAWTDQASTGTNHGNESLIAKGNATAGSDERRAYIALDMTGYAGCTYVANLIIVAQCSNSNALLAATMTCTATTTATKPFTESTVTWAAPPTIGGAAGSVGVSIAAGGGFAAYSFSFASASVNLFVGNWVLFTFTGPTGALPDTFTIKSRDDATASNRPKISFTVQRGT